MKLRLPLRLVSLLLLTHATVLHADNYVWTGSQDGNILEDGNWSPGLGGAGQAIWGNGAMNTMILGGSSSNKNLTVTFDGFSLGGITVENSAVEYSLKSDGDKTRNLDLNGEEGNEAVFSMNEDFSLGTADAAWKEININSGLISKIAEGKRLNIYGDVKGSAGGIDLSGGGTMYFHGAYTYTGNLNITEGEITFSSNTTVYNLAGSSNAKINTQNNQTLTINVSGATPYVYEGAIGANTKLLVTGGGVFHLKGIRSSTSASITVEGATLDLRGGGQLFANGALDLKNVVNINQNGIIIFDKFKEETGGNLGGLWSSFDRFFLNEGGTIKFTGEQRNVNRSINITGSSTLEVLNSEDVYMNSMSSATQRIVIENANLTLTLTGAGTGGLNCGTADAGMRFYDAEGNTNADTLAIVKNGSGTWMLGSNYGSQLGGGITINEGTLQIGQGGSAHGDLGSASVVNNAQLVFNRTGSLSISNNLTGTGKVTFDGGGTYILLNTTAWSHTGGTTISNATLQIGNGAGIIGIGNGAIENNGELVFNLSGSTTVTNTLSGTGKVTFGGIGTYILENSSPWTYTGQTVISDVTLQLGNGGSTGDFGAGEVVNNGELVLNRGTDIQFNGRISGTGSIRVEGTATYVISAVDAWTHSGGTVINSGNLQWGTSNSTAGAYGLGTGEVTVNDGGTLTIWLHRTAAASTYREVTNTINLNGGGKIYAEDGSYILNHLNINTTAGEEALMQTRWAKHFAIEKLTGSGNLVFLGRTDNAATADSGIFLREVDSDFSGKIELRGTTSNLQQRIQLESNTAARNASVALDSSAGGVLFLRVATDNAVIKGLDGTGANNTIDSTGGVRTLTVDGGGQFAGTLGADLNLVKSGADTLVLTGTSTVFDKTLTVTEGILDTTGYQFSQVDYKLSGGILKAGQLTSGHTISSDGQSGSIIENLDLNGGSMTFTSNSTGSLSDFTTLNVSGDLTLGASTEFVFINEATITEGLFDLITVGNGINSAYYDGDYNLQTNLYTLSGLATNNTRYDISLAVSQDAGKIQLKITGNAANLVWLGNSDGVWDFAHTGEVFWGGATDGFGNYFYNGDTVTFGDIEDSDGSVHLVRIGQDVLPSHVIVNAEHQDYVFTEDVEDGLIRISGMSRLTKEGEGSLTILTNNDYSGGTYINGGAIDAAVSGALGAGDIHLSGGSLKFMEAALPASGMIYIASSGGLEWGENTSTDISGILNIENGSLVTLEIGDNELQFNTALSGISADYTVRTGSDGKLTLNTAGGIKGSLTVDEGTVFLSGGGGSGYVHGEVIINEGGKLITSGDSFGYTNETVTVTKLTLNGGTLEHVNVNLTLSNVEVVFNGGLMDITTGLLDIIDGTTFETSLGTVNRIQGAIRLRQDDSEFNIAEDSSLTLAGNISQVYANGGITKNGEGTLILAGETNASSGAYAINSGTLQIGNGGSMGRLGSGQVSINANGTLSFLRTGNLNIDNQISGSGDIVFDGDAASIYTLGRENQFSGSIDVQAGQLILGDAGALGDGATLSVFDGAILDYNGFSGNGAVSIVALNGSCLNQVNGALHTLDIGADAVVTAAGGILVSRLSLLSGSHLTVSDDVNVSSSITLDEQNALEITGGSLEAGSITLKDQSSTITVGGDITVRDGGSFRVGRDNDGTAMAFVQGTGNVSVSGRFNLNVDANIGQGDHTYYLFGAGESGTYSSIDAVLSFAEGTEYLESFFDLDTSDFDTTGKVSVNRLEWIIRLFDQPEVDGLISPYVPGETNEYIGAKSEVRPGEAASPSNPLLFNADYAALDDAYRLTDGLGWMNFQTQMSGADNMLLISGYFAEEGSLPLGEDGHGIIISNNNNNFGAGTRILGAHVILDGSLAHGGPSLWAGQENTLLGTGRVDIGGTEAILELRPAGSGDRSEHVMANELALHDGATLSQTGGSNVLAGAVFVTGSGATLLNTTSNYLTLTQSLAGTADAIVTVAGDGVALRLFRFDSIEGNVGLLKIQDNALLSMNNGTSFLANSIELSGSSLNLDGATVSSQTLIFEGNAALTVSGGSELSFNGIENTSSSGQGQLVLSGGTLNISGNVSFGERGVRLAFEDSLARALSVDAYNTLNVTVGSQVTLSDLTSADGSFTKIGEGLLVLSGDFASYAGTATVGEGRMNMNASQYGGSLVAGADGTETFLAVAAGSTVGGSLIANGNATVTLGNGASVNGGLAIDNATFTAGNDVTLGGSLLTIGEDSRVTFGRNTNIASNAPGLEVASGSSLRFGRGSSITGTLANGVTIGGGAAFSGFLDAGFNDFTLSSGSVFLLTQDDLNQYGGSTVGVSSRRTITVEEGAVFQLDSGLNFTTIPVWPEGVITILAGEGNGTVTIGGSTVVENADYSQYLGDTDYMWYFFNLIGGDNSLFLEIRANVEFDTLAETANEKAIADTASDIAMSASRLEGEIRDLGGALAMSTTANAHYNLSQLALSTSGVMAGFTAQMENLRRHTFDILNRAVQEKPGVERLSYEQHHNTVWANGLGGSYKLKGDGNAVGNTTNVWGGTVGASTGVTENLIVGLALTYTNSDTRLDRAMGKSEADAYYVDLFGRYRKENWTVTGVVTGGWTSLDIERDLSLEGYSSHSKSKPNGKQVMGLVQVGYEFTVSRDQNSKLEPFVLVSGGYSEIDSLNEKGAGTAGLNVESQSQGLCTLGGGVRFIREYITDRDLASRGRFEARAMVLQDLTDLKPEVKGHFQGRPESRFQLEGAAPGKTAFVIGAGVVQPIGAQVSLFADVDGEFRRDETGVRGTVGVKYCF